MSAARTLILATALVATAGCAGPYEYRYEYRVSRLDEIGAKLYEGTALNRDDRAFLSREFSSTDVSFGNVWLRREELLERYERHKQEMERLRREQDDEEWRRRDRDPWTGHPQFYRRRGRH